MALGGSPIGFNVFSTLFSSSNSADDISNLEYGCSGSDRIVSEERR